MRVGGLSLSEPKTLLEVLGPPTTTPDGLVVPDLYLGVGAMASAIREHLALAMQAIGLWAYVEYDMATLTNTFLSGNFPVVSAILQSSHARGTRERALKAAARTEGPRAT